jgi:pyruvate,orthophosphate dikinase
MTDALVLLQAARLKGRLTLPVAQLFSSGAEAGVAALEQAGYLQGGPAGGRLTPAGRDELARLIAAERDAADARLLERLYARFDPHNSELKATISAWQLRPDGTPNDHADPAYDAEVIARLQRAHHDATDLLDELATAVPRLGHYPVRLGAAARAVEQGDTRFVANPLADSYHQVWFELHEDLLGLLGRDRAAEAMAGRAE